MIDISGKTSTLRVAAAQAVLKASPSTIAAVRQGAVPKGDALQTARIAATQAAKNTSQIIPYCHPLPIDFVGIEFELKDDRIVVTATAKAIHKTGVEMEALTAASVAALTLYDMLKMLDTDMEITDIKLLSKSGGKSDFRDTYDFQLRAAVLVSSDSVAAGEKDDRSGRLIVERLEKEGFTVADYRIVPDNAESIAAAVREYCDQMELDLVLTTGGTGLGPRDNTREAVAPLVEREAPGIAEAIRAYGQQRTPRAMLSRGLAGVRGKTIIVSLPGSSRGVAESLDALFPGIMHAFGMIQGGGHPAAAAPKEGPDAVVR